MRWVSLTEAILFQERMVNATGGSVGVLDRGKLEAALARPLAIVFNHEPFPTPALKVAALIDSIITTHPFRDGNKRTAMGLGLAILEFNFPLIKVPLDDDIEDMAVALAERQITLRDIAHWLETLYGCSTLTPGDFDPSDLHA